MMKIIILLGAIFVCLIVSSGCTEAPTKENSPNIIFVLADDLGYGDLSSFNDNSKIHTPNLDAMAKEGIRFTDAHTSSSVCTPTRYGILTGRYNWRSKLKSSVLTGKSKALIPPDRSTVASLLQKQGYYTAFIGKWHLGWDWALKNPDDFGGEGWSESDFSQIDFSKPIKNSPNDRGFSYAFGHSGSLDMAPYVYVENNQITRIPDSVTVNKGKYSWWREGPTSRDFIHEDVTPNFFRRTMALIKERAQIGSPFFLYLALPSPHTPILPTAEWQGKSDLNPYGDFVMMIDEYMGQLLNTVKSEGIDNNTLIIFTSDNGCSPAAKIDELIAKDHHPSYIFRGHKADIFEGGHRVPFIARWPGKIAKGKICDEIICTTDFMATCAEIVGCSLSDDEGEDSFSILPYLEEKSLDQPIRDAVVHHSINGSFAIRKGNWKLIMCPGSGGWSYPRPNQKEVISTLPKIQLYNLESDPGETNNVQKDNKDIVHELKSLLIECITEGRSTPGPPRHNDPIDGEWKQIWFIDTSI